MDNSFLYERAVERAVQIISEAARELPLELRNKYPDVHWQPIIEPGHQENAGRARQLNQRTRSQTNVALADGTLDEPGLSTWIEEHMERQEP